MDIPGTFGFIELTVYVTHNHLRFRGKRTTILKYSYLTIKCNLNLNNTLIIKSCVQGLLQLRMSAGKGNVGKSVG